MLHTFPFYDRPHKQHFWILFVISVKAECLKIAFIGNDMF